MMADRWQSIAEDYEKRLWEVVGRECIKAAIRAVEAEGNPGVAGDFGCGTGLFTRHLARGAEKVIALDTSEAMLACARRKLKDLTNIEWLQASCMKTGLPEESLDTVLMANVLQMVPDRPKALGEAARVLRPGGRLIVLAWTATGMSLWQKATMMWRYLRNMGLPPRGSRNLGPDEARELARANGFEVDKLELLCSRVKCLHMRATRHGEAGR